MKASPADLQFIRDLAYRQAALVIEPDKDYLIESRLETLIVKLGLPDIATLVSKARLNGAGLQKRIIEALTIHETYFFRDTKPFDALQKQLFSELKEKNSSEKRLNIWSAACSSGQEPYSLAMLIRESFNMSEWQVRIIATDISDAILDRARQGIYSQLEVGRGLPPALQNKYFQRVEGGWQIKEEVRKMVEFKPLNLSQNWGLMPPMDLILIRNVLIYFDAETKKQIFEKIRRILKPTGYLFLGATESPAFLDTTFKSRDVDRTVCYTMKEKETAG